jgi:hypothetical protein
MIGTFGPYFLYYFDKALEGGSGPRRLIRALAEETVNLICLVHTFCINSTGA